MVNPDGPLLRPMSVRYYGAPEVDGPDGNRDHPAKMAGGSGRVAIRRNIFARYARAPKSVIDLKSMQKYPNSVQGKPLVRGAAPYRALQPGWSPSLRSCWQSSFGKSVIIHGRW